MLIIMHNDIKIEVRFFHKICKPCDIESITGTSVDENRRCSLATVMINDRHTYQGMAICYPHDNFCRATGRKKALANALYPLCDKELRTKIWEEYHIQCRL